MADKFVPESRIGSARYILRRILGRGIGGVVWLAWDVKQGREIALKILPDVFLADENAAERIRMVWQKSANLEHPHIARAFDFVHDPDCIALTSEYVHGWSLAALRVDKPGQRFSLAEATPWIRQICAALVYAHEHGSVLHQDLRLTNLMLNEREDIRITDFGIAPTLRHLGLPMTSGQSAESLGYLSPQQALGETVSVCDDVYGLGAVIFALLTGTPPFYKGQVLAQVCELPPPSIAERLAELGLEDSVPPVVEDTVKRCLAKKAADRPQSVREVIDLLERSEVPAPPAPEKAAVEEPQPTPTPPPPAPEPAEESFEEQPTEPLEAVPALEIPATAPAIVTTQPPAGRKAQLVLVAVVGIALLLTAVLGLRFGLGSGTPSAKSNYGANSFQPPTNADHEIRIAVEQPDHKIVVAGMFTQFGEGTNCGIARIGPDGSLDKTFSVAALGDVFALALQPDGKILIGGGFTNVNGRACRHIARLNTDGTLDEDFVRNASANGVVRALALQADGKILAGGNFDWADGKQVHRLTRLQADGTRDSSFNVGAGAPATVWALAVQADGRIIAVGDFQNFNHKPYRRVVRLNPSGSVDEQFKTGDGANAVVYAVAIQGDGRVLIAGDFESINHLERQHLARLNPDGSTDWSFAVGTGPDRGVRCLALQPDGKVLIGGIFASVQGAPRSRLARLLPNGEVDTAFDPGEVSGEVVRWVMPQADGKVLAVGAFRKFAGTDCTHLALLNSNGNSSVTKIH